MYELVFERSKGIAEGIARFTRNQPVFSEMFNRLMQFSRRQDRSPAAYCEVWLFSGVCPFPNGKFCSDACWEGNGLSARCPQGYQPSYAWGFRYTGCWCDTYEGRNVVCCDCTPYYNSPYVASFEDCGCMHYLD